MSKLENGEAKCGGEKRKNIDLEERKKERKKERNKERMN